MIDPLATHKAEQGIAMFNEFVPTLLFGFYVRCVEEGFPQEVALYLTTQLLQTYTKGIEGQ